MEENSKYGEAFKERLKEYYNEKREFKEKNKKREEEKLNEIIKKSHIEEEYEEIEI